MEDPDPINEKISEIEEERLNLVNGKALLGLLETLPEVSPVWAQKLWKQVEFMQRLSKSQSFKDDDTCFYIEFTVDLLLRSVAINVLVNHLGPIYFSQIFPLAPFILSYNPKFSTAGKRLALLLYMNLPKFADWTHFITLDPLSVVEMQRIMPTLLAGHPAAPAALIDRDRLAQLRATFMDILVTPYLPSPAKQGSSAVYTPVAAEHVYSSMILVQSQQLRQQGEDTPLEQLSRSQELIQRAIQTIRNPSFDNISQINDEVEAENGEASGSSSSGQPARSFPKSPSFDEIFDGETLHPVNEAVMSDMIRELLQVHQLRRRINQQHFDEKRKYLMEKCTQNEASAVTFRAHLAIQERGIHLLEQLYDLLAQWVTCTDLSNELCLVDNLLESMCNISVSIVVVGLISVGKSTFVNCLVGQHLAPDRNDTITAIPIRYLNDASQKEPKMLVPFTQELNTTCAAIKALITSRGLQTLLSSLLKVHLQHLLRQIDGGLRFDASYTGIERIREVSTQIHDLFRLAVDPALPEEISSFLPFSWRDSLDTYLTVSYRFPELDPTSGLVTLSLVDTPGIDEDGVQKLGFHRVITDSISTSNFAVMLTAVDRTAALAMEPLRFLFHEARRKYGIPSMLVITHDEGIQKTERDTFLSNCTDTAVHVDEENKSHTIFTKQEVFLVSGIKKLSGTRMLSYLEAHQRKPQENGEDPEARMLASDWIFNASFGVNLEEKRENYEAVDVPTLTKHCKKLITASNMDQPIEKLIDAAVRKAIPLNVHTNLKKALDLIGNLTDRLKEESIPVSVEGVKQVDQKIMSAKKKLETDKLKYGRQVKELARKIKDRVVEEKVVTFRFVEMLMDTGIPENSTSDHLAARISFHIKALKNPKVSEIVTLRPSVEFPSKEAFCQGYLELLHAVKMGIADHFVSHFKDVPTELRKWSEGRQEELKQKANKLAQLYEQTFSLPRQAPSTSGGGASQPVGSDIQFGYEQRLRPVLEEELQKKHKRQILQQVLTRIFPQRGQDAEALGKLDFKAAPEPVLVNAAELRKDLKLHSKTVIDELAKELKPQIDKLVAELVENEWKEVKVAVSSLIRYTERRLSGQADKQLEPKKQLLKKVIEAHLELETALATVREFKSE